MALFCTMYNTRNYHLFACKVQLSYRNDTYCIFILESCSMLLQYGSSDTGKIDRVTILELISVQISLDLLWDTLHIKYKELQHFVTILELYENYK